MHIPHSQNIFEKQMRTMHKQNSLVEHLQQKYKIINIFKMYVYNNGIYLTKFF